MIQTQLLRLDPPYQVITAGELVGVQVATLIVTEESRDEDGAYGITTHSHPVVNYSIKELITDGKSHRFFPLSPEGAVWDKVEIKDIRVLGLVGEDLTQSAKAFCCLLTYPYSYIAESTEDALEFCKLADRLKWNMALLGIRINLNMHHVIQIVPMQSTDLMNPLVGFQLIIADLALGYVFSREDEELLSILETLIVRFIKPLVYNSSKLRLVVGDEGSLEGLANSRYLSSPKTDKRLSDIVRIINKDIKKNNYQYVLGSE